MLSLYQIITRTMNDIISKNIEKKVDLLLDMVFELKEDIKVRSSMIKEMKDNYNNGYCMARSLTKFNK